MALQIGSHVSMSKGLIGAVKDALSYGADTFMIFTGAFTDKDVDFGINQIAYALNQILAPEQNIIVCLETPGLDSKTNLYTEEIAFLRKDEYVEE